MADFVKNGSLTLPTGNELNPGNSKVPPYICVSLAHGWITYVEMKDVALLKRYRWFVKMSNRKPYIVRRCRIGRKETYLRFHRVIMNAKKGEDVHHINHDTLDNRRTNLERMPTEEHRHIKKTKRKRGDSP